MFLPPNNGHEVLPLKCYKTLNFLTQNCSLWGQGVWVFYNPPSIFPWAVLADKVTGKTIMKWSLTKTKHICKRKRLYKKARIETNAFAQWLVTIALPYSKTACLEMQLPVLLWQMGLTYPSVKELRGQRMYLLNASEASWQSLYWYESRDVFRLLLSQFVSLLFQDHLSQADTAVDVRDPSHPPSKSLDLVSLDSTFNAGCSTQRIKDYRVLETCPSWKQPRHCWAI